MKVFLASLIVAILILSCNGNTATGYNDTIIKPQLEAITKLDSIYAGPEVSVEKIKQHREELVSIVNKTITDIKKSEDFKGNKSFREAALKYFSHLNFVYNKTLNIDSLIYKSNSEERAQTMSEKDYNFMVKESQKYVELETQLLDEQKKFAKQFNIQLQY